MAVGAYITSILNIWLFTSDQTLSGQLLPGSSALYLFPITLLLGGIGAALVGLLVAIPSFRTRGDYLAIITLAVNYIVKSAIENIQAIGGARGFMGMRKVIDAMTKTVNLPWVLIWTLVVAAVTIVVLKRFVHSTYGRGVVAIADDEIAAEIMGVNSQRMKMIAFMLSSGMAGIAGGLFAHVLGYINPGTFTIMKSTEVMVMVYLGGMGSLSGSVLSAIGFTLILELLRPLQLFKWVVIPFLLIILMLFRPEGIMGHRELTDIFPKLRWFSSSKEKRA
jgi:branched-chain amino acid transport system permease protein